MRRRRSDGVNRWPAVHRDDAAAILELLDWRPAHPKLIADLTADHSCARRFCRWVMVCGSPGAG